MYKLNLCKFACSQTLVLVRDMARYNQTQRGAQEIIYYTYFNVYSYASSLFMGRVWYNHAVCTS